MRPLLAGQLALALVQAFLLAPVQHVHEAPDHDGGHEHATLIHAHFLPHLAIPVPGRGPVITDNDGPEVWSLDNFTIVLPAVMHAVVPGAAPELAYAPRAILGAAIAIEERAHAPPIVESSIPRAPPV